MAQKKFTLPDDRSGEEHVEGLPIGTRGGTLIKYLFPADGEYIISWIPVREVHGEMYANVKGEKLEVLLDGERIGMFDIDKLPAMTKDDNNEVRVRVTAGLHAVGVTFLATTQIPLTI